MSYLRKKLIDVNELKTKEQGYQVTRRRKKHQSDVFLWLSQACQAEISKCRCSRHRSKHFHYLMSAHQAACETTRKKRLVKELATPQTNEHPVLHFGCHSIFTISSNILRPKSYHLPTAKMTSTSARGGDDNDDT